MLTAIRRAWLRMQLTLVQIETAQAEQAERDLPRHLEVPVGLMPPAYRRRRSSISMRLL